MKWYQDKRFQFAVILIGGIVAFMIFSTVYEIEWEDVIRGWFD